MITCITIALLIALPSAHAFVPACREMATACTLAAPSGVVTTFCDTTGKTQTEYLCPDSTVPTAGVGVGFCEIWLTSVGVAYPGPCGCPNDCSGKGACVGSSCTCNAGWRGTDCSLPSCAGATCSGRGTCGKVNGEETCTCADGFAGADCGTTLPAGGVPSIIETVDVKHYSDKDAYKQKHPVLNVSALAQIRLTVSEADLAWFNDPANLHNDTYFKAQMWFDNGVVRETMTNVGFRHAGSLMLLFPKKNIKLSFSTFSSGRRWYGLKGLQLKATGDLDPTYTREIMTTSVAYSLGQPIYRVGYANVHVNAVNWGLYVMYEPVDENFYDTRAALGSSKAAVWKSHWGANFSYLGNNPDTYKGLVCGTDPCYEGDTDAAEEDYTPLVKLFAALNSPASVLEDLLPAVIDVDFTVQMLVLEVVTANWDGLANSGNNLMLYQDVDTGLFKIFRHDLDLSWGFPLSMGLPMKDMTETDVYAFAPDHPLYASVLSVPSFRAKYTALFRDLLKAYFTTDGALTARLYALRDIARQAALADRYRTQGIGLTAADFENNFGVDVSQIRGVMPFMQKRIAAAIAQLNS